MIQLSRLATIVPFALSAPDPVAYRRYGLVDRGSYAYCDDAPVPDALVAMAAEITARNLQIASARLLRLVPGDYLLAHHDALHDDHRVEVIVDLSQVAVPGAEVRYLRRSQAVFRLSSQPGMASIVERDPATRCHHTYVSKLHTGASVVRLVVQLRDA